MTPMRDPRNMNERELLYVLAERVEHMRDDIGGVSGKLDSLTAGVNHLDDVERRVSELEEWQRWAQRLILGSVGGAFMSIVLAGAQVALNR